MAAAAKQWILQSRLGVCWKCMVFAGSMLVISAAAFVMTMRWQDLEGTDSVVLARLSLCRQPPAPDLPA